MIPKTYYENTSLHFESMQLIVINSWAHKTKHIGLDNCHHLIPNYLKTVVIDFCISNYLCFLLSSTCSWAHFPSLSLTHFLQSSVFILDVSLTNFETAVTKMANFGKV